MHPFVKHSLVLSAIQLIMGAPLKASPMDDLSKLTPTDQNHPSDVHLESLRVEPAEDSTHNNTQPPKKSSLSDIKDQMLQALTVLNNIETESIFSKDEESRSNLSISTSSLAINSSALEEGVQSKQPPMEKDTLLPSPPPQQGEARNKPPLPKHVASSEFLDRINAQKKTRGDTEAESIFFKDEASDSNLSIGTASLAIKSSARGEQNMPQVQPLIGTEITSPPPQSQGEDGGIQAPFQKLVQSSEFLDGLNTQKRLENDDLYSVFSPEKPLFSQYTRSTQHTPSHESDLSSSQRKLSRKPSAVSEHDLVAHNTSAAYIHSAESSFSKLSRKPSAVSEHDLVAHNTSAAYIHSAESSFSKLSRKPSAVSERDLLAHRTSAAYTHSAESSFSKQKIVGQDSLGSDAFWAGPDTDASLGSLKSPVSRDSDGIRSTSTTPEQHFLKNPNILQSQELDVWSVDEGNHNKAYQSDPKIEITNKREAKALEESEQKSTSSNTLVAREPVAPLNLKEDVTPRKTSSFQDFEALSANTANSFNKTQSDNNSNPSTPHQRKVFTVNPIQKKLDQALITRQSSSALSLADMYNGIYNKTKQATYNASIKSAEAISNVGTKIAQTPIFPRVIPKKELTMPELPPFVYRANYEALQFVGVPKIDELRILQADIIRINSQHVVTNAR